MTEIEERQDGVVGTIDQIHSAWIVGISVIIGIVAVVIVVLANLVYR